MADPCLLVGDIGGTNARFALADSSSPGFTGAMTLNCADFATADTAIRAYLDSVGESTPQVICLAAAGPVADESVRFTNNHWSLDARSLRKAFDTPGVELLNDFESIAYSIPFLTPGDCLPIGLPAASQPGDRDFTIGVIGPGTGLGAVGLICRGGDLFPIVGEAGHTGFAPETQVQVDVLSMLRDRFDRVSNERLVSGPGIENVYWALSKIHGDEINTLDAADIFAAGDEPGNARAAEAVQFFFETLGQVAGNLALSLGAWDGVYIAGGISRRYPETLVNSRFRLGFESKGRHRTLMESIPTQLVTMPEPGLLGASYCALRMFGDDSQSPDNSER